MGEVVALNSVEDIESVRNPAVRAALPLMKQALAVLDAGGAGFTTVACNLSLAIDRAEERTMPTAEEAFLAVMPEQLASAFEAKASG